MTEHVGDRITDYLAGRLDDAGRRRVEDHVQRCSDCADQLDWCRDLKEAALQEGVSHVAPPRILDLARDRSAATPTEAAHVETCESCGREIAWAAGLPDEAALPEDGDSTPRATGGSPGGARIEATSPAPRRGRPGRLGWVGAGLAAAAVVLALMVLPGRPSPDTAGLAVVEPLPVRITRAVPEAGSFEEARLLGLDAYAAGDYATALARLAEASRMQPADPEVRLYVASAVLLQGNRLEARRLLEPIAVADGEPQLRHESNWLLAQIALLENRPDEARPLLRRVVESGGRHDQEARRILGALDGDG